MIDFTLTEEQLMIQKLARDFAQKEVAPKIRENDQKAYFDMNILTKMGELGILGLSIPTRYGGSGGDYISLGLACEELEYVDTSLRVILSVHIGLNSLTVLSWGTEEQKQKYLVPQAQGKKIATFGLTEP
ncbi:MAG: acyl-CoA dehydrogenase family protein, partial [candidate division WOR-3 bacterium]|nr:acyl-CoA dehydrogenase family protein [candidate division WOR-3 bacterium]